MAAPCVARHSQRGGCWMRSMLCVPMHGCATGSAPAGKPASTERTASESVRLFCSRPVLHVDLSLGGKPAWPDPAHQREWEFKHRHVRRLPTFGTLWRSCWPSATARSARLPVF
ncbi:hypothetical protein L1887_54816 [Cichorium endivia]|nr:hypothetical protein L1887_54816 [Cichorium endivia]